jgi:nucleotide-binding universal stress UspA family protein
MRLLTLSRIVAATDLSPEAGRAVHGAAELARLAGAGLDVVYAPPEGGGQESSLPALESHLKEAGVGGEARPFVVPGPDAAEALVAHAMAVDADVIVFGPHRRGEGLGSTARRVVAASGVPTLVLPGEMRLPLARVLVAADLSAGSRAALAVGLAWSAALRAREGGTELMLLHVAAEGGCGEVRGKLEEELATVGGMQRWAGVEVRTECVESGDPAGEILRAAGETGAGLLVMGVRGRSGEPHGPADRTHTLLGGTSAAVTRAARTPLLLVPTSAMAGAVS